MTYRALKKIGGACNINIEKSIDICCYVQEVVCNTFLVKVSTTALVILELNCLLEFKRKRRTLRVDCNLKILIIFGLV